MNFVNPFELLDVAEADAASIKKAKRRKLAEFDLSDDGMIEVGNQKVTKSDFIRVTDELDSNDKAEFYLFVKNNPRLNAFLTNGDTSFFTNYRQESIYSDADFVNFISPYFAQQYNKVLLEAYQNDNIPLLKRIVANPPLVNSRDTEKAYKGLSQFLKTIEEELHEIRTEIDNEESYYDEDTVDELDADLREKANNDAINILPSYFQAQRNEIAQKVRNISVAVFNGINNAEVAFQIVSYSLEFNTNNLTKQKLQKDYEQIKEIYENRKESEQFSPELAKYAGALLQIVQLIKQVENRQIATDTVPLKIYLLLPSIGELNNLPNIFDDVREQLALAIRSLSVTIWNKEGDINTALALIRKAQEINLNLTLKQEIEKNYNELCQIRDKQVSSIIEVLQGINKVIRQANMSYNQTVNTNEVRKVLNGLFNKKSIHMLMEANLTLKSQLLDQLRTILTILPSREANDLIEKLNVITENNSGLISKLNSMRIEKASINQSNTSSNKVISLTPPPPLATTTNSNNTTNTTQTRIYTNDSKSNKSSKNQSPNAKTSTNWLVVLLAFIISYVVTSIIASATHNSASYSNNSPTDYPSRVSESSPNNTYNATNTYIEPEPEKESQYKGNQLANGASPLNACFGKGRFGGNAWLLFKNSNSSDAIVCLVSVGTGKTIRNEYIRAGSNYRMENIPSGTYYLKVFYGNDWNPTLENVCGTKGSFESNPHFSKSDDSSDWIEIENSDYFYSTGEITLYAVTNGNMSQSPINEQSFFNN